MTIKKGDIVSPNHIGEEVVTNKLDPVTIDWTKYRGRVISDAWNDSPLVGDVVRVAWFGEAKRRIGQYSNYPVSLLRAVGN